MWIHTYTQGYLAPSQIPDPTQRAIVVSYDNELNMPASGMCENWAVSVQKCPLSHSLIDPPPPTDTHTQKKTWLAYKCFRPQRGANVWRVDRRADARGHPGCRPKSTIAICRGGGGASPKCLEVNCRAAGLWALIRDEWMREQASASALEERSQVICGGEDAKIKILQVVVGGVGRFTNCRT